MLIRPGRLLAALALVLVGVPVAAQPAYADDALCSDIDADEVTPAATGASDPFDALGVQDAWDAFERRGLEPGQGVTVAVVDSGVSPRADRAIDIDQAVSAVSQEAPVYYHGSAVAGLIAAAARGPGKPVGIAPGAKIADVRVFDTEPAGNGLEDVETPHVVDGLRWILEQGSPQIKVVNISLDVDDDPALKAAVDELLRKDIVVVAASGNRPLEGEPGFDDYGTLAPGEDAAKDIFPAGYDGVVAVTATTDGANFDPAAPPILRNSAIDVSAPTANAISVALNGQPCTIGPEAATSWATAEVSGVVALLRSWYPHDSAAQIVARLEATANGTYGDSTPWTGHGVVQPFEALTRPLTITAKGQVAELTQEEDQTPKADPPPPVDDPLGSLGDDAVWWGVFCGGAVVLALVLRPILSRRRRAD